jgi:hypothetical protein
MSFITGYREMTPGFLGYANKQPDFWVSEHYLPAKFNRELVPITVVVLYG